MINRMDTKKGEGKPRFPLTLTLSHRERGPTVLSY